MLYLHELYLLYCMRILSKMPVISPLNLYLEIILRATNKYHTTRSSLFFTKAVSTTMFFARNISQKC